MLCIINHFVNNNRGPHKAVYVWVCDCIVMRCQLGALRFVLNNECMERNPIAYSQGFCRLIHLRPFKDQVKKIQGINRKEHNMISKCK